MSIRFEGTHLSSITLPYRMPPYTFENNQILLITFRTSLDVLRDLVPEPLVVNPNNLITIFVSRLNVIELDISYYEAGIAIPTSYGDQEGSYIPILYLDKALPIITSREVWGFPKLPADDFCLDVENAVLHASVVKEGTTLIDATLHVEEPVPPTRSTTPSPPAFVFLLKLIPSVKGNSIYDVKQLTKAVIRGGMAPVFRGEIYREVRPDEATLHLGSTGSAPFGMIPVLEIVSGVYTIGDFVLDYGEVVHDYLAKGKTIVSQKI